MTPGPADAIRGRRVQPDPLPWPAVLPTDDETELCLLQVHAHPDDEASKGAGTAARYADEGVRTVLVCCTGGEAGDILTKELDTPENRANLGELRMRELEASCEALRYSALHLLGYHDSGMPDTEVNHRPDNFWNADLDEATERLVRIIRHERPQVLMAYADDHSRYPHPDHIRVHDVSIRAFDAAGDPDCFPDAGDPFQPLKLYYMGFWSKARILLLHKWFSEQDGENPYERWMDNIDTYEEAPFTTRIDVGDHLEARRQSLLAHRTQVDPSGFWMRMPDHVTRELFPWEEFVLARTHIETGVAVGEWEIDLFAGLRSPVGRGRGRGGSPR
jgi:mycothiol S-conjugate amidase